jgi:hypothetical protein
MPPFLPLATALRHHIHAPASFSAPDSQVNAFHFFLGHFIGFDTLLEQDGG